MYQRVGYPSGPKTMETTCVACGVFGRDMSGGQAFWRSCFLSLAFVLITTGTHMCTHTHTALWKVGPLEWCQVPALKKGFPKKLVLSVSSVMSRLPDFQILKASKTSKSCGCPLHCWQKHLSSSQVLVILHIFNVSLSIKMTTSTTVGSSEITKDHFGAPETIVEVPLDSLSLTWGTAWEAEPTKNSVKFIWFFFGIFFPHHQVLDLNFFTSTSVMHFSQRVEGTLGHYRWNLLGGHEGLVLVLGVFPKNPWVIPWAQLVEGTFGAITWYVPIRQCCVSYLHLRFQKISRHLSCEPVIS